MSTIVKLISYNTHLFGGTIPADLGGVEYEDDQRRQAILNKILRSGADIVCLQEVWSDEARQWFVDKAGSNYWGSFFPDENTGLKISSGLLVLVKGSVENPFFYPFKDGIGSDGWATKGFAGATIRSQSGQVLAHIITTHTQSGQGYQNEQVRKSQVNQLCNALYEKKKQQSWKDTDPIIVCGDINVIAEAKGGKYPTSEYRVIRQIFEGQDVFDAYRLMHPVDDPAKFNPGYTLNILRNKLARYFSPDEKPQLQRLDYIWMNTINPNVAINSIEVETYGWVYSNSQGLMDDSDHYPLFMEFEIKS